MHARMHVCTCMGVALTGQMRLQAHRDDEGYRTREMAEAKARAQLYNGEALAAFRQMVTDQGGDATVVDSFAQCGSHRAHPSPIPP